MILYHPEVAYRSCASCKQWLYGSDGKIKKRLGKDIPRPTGVGTPCHECPKKSPEQAHQYELSERNQKTLSIYWKVQATNGCCLNEHQRYDPILQMNLATIHQIVTEYRQYQQSKSNMDLIALLFAAKH